MQDICPINDLQRVAHIMIGDQDADATILEVRYEVADVADRNRIDPGERLIEQDEVRGSVASARAISQRRRSPPDSAIAEARRRWLIENSAKSASSIACRASGSGSETSRMARMFCSTVSAEDRCLLRQIADAEARPAIHRQIGDVLPVELDRPGIGGDEAGDDVEAGGLAGAVGAEQTDDLAALHRHADVAQHRAALEALAEAVATRPRLSATRRGPSPGPGLTIPARHSSTVGAASRRASRLLVAGRRGRRGLAARRCARCRGPCTQILANKEALDALGCCARGAAGHHAADVVVEIHHPTLTSDHILARAR